MHRFALAGLCFASLLAVTPSDAAHKHLLKKVSTITPEAPKESGMRGIYVRGETAGHASFAGLLDRVAAHGMNSIVLDVKDYDGKITFPSHVALASESGLTKNAPMESFANAVHLAHAKGLKVIARISCFHDEAMAKAHPGMAVRGVSGHVYHNGWLDPRSEMAQGYILDLVKEAIANGADEIQLDYVRYPVINIKLMDFGLDTKQNPRAKVEVITHFVSRAHAITRAHGVPLSLDVFGVIAMGHKEDIQNLGQDPAELGKHCEVLSPMVYPSHYDAGFAGFENPGDHPELVGMGVKGVVEQTGHGARIRPWLQAMNWNSPTYGPEYIQKEIKSGNSNGGTGWLLWNPGQNFEVSWRALPRK